MQLPHKTTPGLGDVTNARAAFERALTADAATGDEAAARPPEVVARRRELWDAYVAFEHAHGDCASWQAVERRRGEDVGGAAGEADTAVLALSKYRWHALVPFTAAQAHHVQQVGGLGGAVRLGSPRPVRARSPPPPFGNGERPPPRHGGSPLPDRVAPRGGSALDDGMPPAVATLLAALPPALVYDGPMMDVEAVMDTIMQWEGGNGAVYGYCVAAVVLHAHVQRLVSSGRWTGTWRAWTFSRRGESVQGDLLDLLIDAFSCVNSPH